MLRHLRIIAAAKTAIELGLDVNLYSKGRPSALHQAAKFGANDIVEYSPRTAVKGVAK